MNRQRWYASPITLPDGRTYIQGGNGGEDHPEVRDFEGQLRLADRRRHVQSVPAVSAELGGTEWSGVRLCGPHHVLRRPERQSGGNGSITSAGTMPSDGPNGWNSTDVMYAPGKILRCGGGSTTLPETPGLTRPRPERGGGDRHQRGDAVLQEDALDAELPDLGQRHGPRRRQCRRHRWQCGGQPADRRQHERAALESGYRQLDAGCAINSPALRACTTPSLCSCPTARS